MALLSIPSATPSDDEGAGSAPPGLASRAIGRWIPALVGLVLAVLLHVESRPRHDLTLVAPGSARPGESVGLRTLFFPGEQRPEEAQSVDVPVEVHLLDGSGESLASVALRGTPRFGREGSLAIAPDLHGRHVLEARATLPDGSEARARRSLDVREDAPPLPRRGRRVTPLQRFELGPLEKLDPARAPQHLELRVAGGACPQEVFCDLLIWVGAPAATPEVEGAGVRTQWTPPVITTGVVRRHFTVQGPEARTRVIAVLGDDHVAARSLQLPVNPGAPAVRASRALVLPPERPRIWVRSAGEETEWVVDLFREGRWQRSTSISPDASNRLHIVGELAPGLWSAQVRRDPFPSTPVATASFVVGEAGDEPEALLRRIADHPRQSAWLDPMATGLDDLLGESATSPDMLARFMLAQEEREVLVLPEVVHGGEQSAEPELLARLRRYGALLVLFLGLLVSYLLVTAQLKAGRDLDSALIAAGIDDQMLPIPRFRRWLLPLSVALFVLLVFGVVAYMVVSRESW